MNQNPVEIWLQGLSIKELLGYLLAIENKYPNKRYLIRHESYMMYDEKIDCLMVEDIDSPRTWLESVRDTQQWQEDFRYYKESRCSYFDYHYLI